MPNYVTVLSNHSRKQLDKLSDHIAAPILDAIGRLEENPRPQWATKNSRVVQAIEFESATIVSSMIFSILFLLSK